MVISGFNPEVSVLFPGRAARVVIFGSVVGGWPSPTSRRGDHFALIAAVLVEQQERAAFRVLLVVMGAG